MDQWIDIAGKFGIPVVILGGIAWLLYNKIWPLFEKSVERAAQQQMETNKAVTVAVERVGQIETRLADRISAIEAQLAVLGTQVSPLWAAVQTKIAKDLTHPSPQFQEMDELLRRLEALTITPEQQKRLNVLLIERSKSTDPEVTDDERTSAKLMLGVMAKVKIEAQSAAPLGAHQIVAEKPTPAANAGG